MGRNNASLTELKHLSYLRTLEIQVPDVELCPKNFLSKNQINQLIEYKIAIGSRYQWSAVENNSRALELSRCQSIIQEGGGVNMMLKRVEALILKGLEDVATVLNYFRIDAFPNLKRLKVDGCGGKIEYLVDTTETMPPSIFPVVEILDLRSMQDLRQICHGHLPSTSFSVLRELWLDNLPELINLWEDPTGQAPLSSLRQVKVRNCHKMKYLFQQDIIVGDLGQLEYLNLDSCDNMEAILAINAEGAAAQADEIVLHKLEELNLENLPNLVRFFCKTNSLASDSSSYIRAHEPLFNRKVVFPALERLSLEKLDMEEIWHRQLLPAKNFNRLRELSINNCEHLITIFPSNLGQLLQNLEELFVSECHLLEDLYEGDNATSVTLPKIWTVCLQGLPKLKGTWWNKACHESRSFENLNELTIRGCNCMRYLFSFTTSKLLIKLHELEIEECDMMKEIIAIERVEDGEVVDAIVFPKLFSLSLRRMPELTSFYQGNCTLEFQSLVELKIEKCPKMHTFVGSSTNRSKEASEERLEGQTDQEGTVKPFFNKKVVLPALVFLTLQRLDNLKKIWENKLPIDCFNQLSFLSVRECNNLLQVAPSKLLPMLHYLRELIVEECDLVEEVLEQVEDSGGKVMFPYVQTLRLAHLPNLKSFYLGNHALEWPFLKKVEFEDCPKMQTFSSGLLLTPKQDISSLGWLERFWKGDLNSTVQHVFKEGKLGEGEEKEEEETLTTQQFPREVCKEAEDKA
ncbi:unnamed protein product [Ilex paraguariensis]|uniref:Disease resistance protein At4g27190-like leucine-rich repeats domain-containing protein n=1 Tax=Ilex paraguariensis TaxID=185542 RepID=A0ABC8S9B5_9AQUA